MMTTVTTLPDAAVDLLVLGAVPVLAYLGWRRTSFSRGFDWYAYWVGLDARATQTAWAGWFGVAFAVGQLATDGEDVAWLERSPSVQWASSHSPLG